MKFKWLTSDQAASIEKGSAVLIRTRVRPPSYEKHYLYEISGWFRPDLIPSESKYRKRNEYLLIENPINRKLKTK